MSFARPPNSSNANRVSDREQKEQKQAAKHSLLASAANQNYQRCYRAIKAQEPYWAGVTYILTVLDQKAKGVADPLLYTREEMESALEEPRTEASFTSPGWRRKLSWGTYLTAKTADADVARMAAALRKGARTPQMPESGRVHPSQGTFPHYSHFILTSRCSIDVSKRLDGLLQARWILLQRTLLSCTARKMATVAK